MQLVTEPRSSKVEIVVEKLKQHTSLGIDQIQTKSVQVELKTL
jgi:hypothetical protein